MSNPTIVGVTSNVGATASNAPSITLPTGIQSGDLAYITVQANNNSTPLSGFTGWAVVDGPRQGGANIALGYLLSKAVSAADSGAVVSGTLPGSIRWATAAVVLRGATQDAVSWASATSTTTTTNTLPTYTPVAADCLTLLFLAGAGSSGLGPVSTLPPTGYTEQLDASSNYGSAGDQFVYIASKQLAGQAGVAQTPGTCESSVGHRANAWLLTVAPTSPPVAALTASPAGLSVSVDGTGSTATSPRTIASYDWDWGDGTGHGSGSTASHTYATGGSYTVVLTVTDSSGFQGSTSVTLDIQPPAGSVKAQSIDVSTGWSAVGGSPLAVLSDGNDATYVVSPNGPSGSEFDLTLHALNIPSPGQPLKVYLRCKAPLASAATVDAQIYEGATQRASLTNQAITLGDSFGTTTLVFPWSQVSAISTGGWNALKLKLQITAS